MAKTPATPARPIDTRPRFAHLMVDVSGELHPDKYQAIANTARDRIRTIGSGINVVGELIFYASQDEQDVFDPRLAQHLGWFLRDLGEEVDELIDVYAEAVTAGATP
jgi:hypothetical protein